MHTVIVNAGSFLSEPVARVHLHPYIYGFMKPKELKCDPIGEKIPYTVESRYNVPLLQRIHRYNVLFPRSRFHVMENSRSGYNVLSLQRTFFDPLGVRYNATRLYLHVNMGAILSIWAESTTEFHNEILQCTGLVKLLAIPFLTQIKCLGANPTYDSSLSGSGSRYGGLKSFFSHQAL